MKRNPLTNTHVTIDEKEAAQAVKRALLSDPEANLSKIIRVLIRKFLKGQIKL